MFYIDADLVCPGADGIETMYMYSLIKLTGETVCVMKFPVLDIVVVTQ